VPVAGQEIGLLVLSLGTSQWVASLLVALFLIVCLLLILIVLIQRPQGGGLSGAFGAGGGSGQTAFGAKTGDALTIATIAIFVLYLAIAVGLQFAARPDTSRQPVPSITAGEGDQGESAETPESLLDDNAGPEGDSDVVPPEGTTPSTDEPLPAETGDQIPPTEPTTTPEDSPSDGG
jgi:preprotein translocase subunit SecG